MSSRVAARRGRPAPCRYTPRQHRAGKLTSGAQNHSRPRQVKCASHFNTLRRQISIEEPISDASEIYRLAVHLLAREKLVHRPLRLLGLGVSGLVPTAAKQLVLSFSERRRPG
jgi:nucleotidyltransferase/DNA polymerase involved in DNA repair